VSKRIQPPARITIAPENHTPSENPNRIAATTVANAPRVAIARNERMNEKSRRVRNTMPVRPPKSVSVTRPAVGIAAGSYIIATASSGRKMITSITT